MASFADILGQAKQSALNPVRSAKYQGQYGLASIKGAAAGAVQRTAYNVVNNAIGAVTGGLFGSNNPLLPVPDGTKVAGRSGIVHNPLDGINARGEALLNFNWFCSLPTIGGFSLPWYYVEAATPVFQQIETTQIYRNGRHESFPKSYSIPNLRLTFFLDATGLSMQYLRAWQSLILMNQVSHRDMENLGRWGRPADYWQPISLYVSAVNKQEVLSFQYMNCWPLNIDSLQLVSNESGRLTAEVEFQVQDMDLTVEGVPLLNQIGLGGKNFGQQIGNFLGFNSNSLVGRGLASLNLPSFNLPSSISGFLGI